MTHSYTLPPNQNYTQPPTPSNSQGLTTPKEPRPPIPTFPPIIKAFLFHTKTNLFKHSKRNTKSPPKFFAGFGELVPDAPFHANVLVDGREDIGLIEKTLDPVLRGILRRGTTFPLLLDGERMVDWV